MFRLFQKSETKLEGEPIRTVFVQDIVNALKCQNMSFVGEITGLTFASSTLGTETLQKYAQFILENILKNPLALELLKNSLSQGDISIIFGSGTFSGAFWYPSERKIVIEDDNTDLDDILYTVIFELNNAINEAIKNVSFIDFQESEDYALKMETCEFATAENTRRILKFGSEHCHWPFIISLEHFSLEKYLTHTHKPCSGKEGISHFNHYQLRYCDMKSKYLDAMIEIKRSKVVMLKLLIEPEIPDENTVNTLLKELTFEDDDDRKGWLSLLTFKKENTLNVDIDKLSAILKDLILEIDLDEKERIKLIIKKEHIKAEGVKHILEGKNILTLKPAEKLELSVPENNPLILSNSLVLVKSAESMNESITPAYSSYRSYMGYK